MIRAEAGLSVARFCALLGMPRATWYRTRDAIAAIQAAVDQAGRLLGGSLLEDCTDMVTGEVAPVVIVTDNGPA